MGECEKNPKYMLNNCKKSCGSCEKRASVKVEDNDTMLKRTANFGVVQRADGNLNGKTLDNVKAMLHYMEKSEDYLSLPSKIRNNCQNNVRECNLLLQHLRIARIRFHLTIFLE